MKRHSVRYPSGAEAVVQIADRDLHRFPGATEVQTRADAPRRDKRKRADADKSETAESN